MKKIFAVILVVSVLFSQLGISLHASELPSNDPVFSFPGGFYEKEFNLNISTPDAGAKVYYTTDGSDPLPGNESTFEFVDSIKIKSRSGEPNVLCNINVVPFDVTDVHFAQPNTEIFKCSTVKAVAIGKDGARSKVITHSYFVDPDIKTRYSLPVISLVTDKANLFDDQKGIYDANNARNKGSDWERSMHIEFFEPGGKLGFSQYVGARIHGGYSRVFPQKSFRLYADHDYDENKKFKYDVFPNQAYDINGEHIDSFSRLILRGGGNDFFGVMFRDEVIQSLVSHLNIPTQAYRPSVVFLDGEYWGIYNIRERYDEKYLSSHYDLDKKKVAILDVWEYPELQEGGEEDVSDYTNDIVKYLKENDITKESTYEYIKTKMDIENFIDYNITNIYVGNHDWPGNNVCIWRYKTDDGKYHPEASYGQDGRWRWFIKDTDFGLGIWGTSPSSDTLSYSLGDLIVPGYEYANEPWAVQILKTLLKNDEFRNQFISRFADQINTSFEPDRVKNEIDNSKSQLVKDIKEHLYRWVASGISESGWENDIEFMKDFADERPDYMRGFIAEKFKDSGVDGTVQLKIASDLTKGHVKINTIDIEETTLGVKNASEWTGTYFKGVPTTLKALPMKGYKFSHWEGISNVDTKLDTISIVPEKDMNIKAVFSLVSAEPTPLKGYTLSGYVSADLKGYMTPNGPSKEGFSIELSGGQYIAKTDATGFFKISNIDLGDKKTTIVIKKKGYLKREIKDIVINSDLIMGTSEKPVLIWAGDMEVKSLQDNAINMLDIFELAKSFNTTSSDEYFNSQCDFNNDLAINMLDVIIVAKNFSNTTDDYPAVSLSKPELKTRYKDDIFASLKIERDIQYKEALNYAGKNEKLLLDVYSPEGDTELRRPVILYVHGGGLSSGSKEEDILASRMAAKGYVVVSVNYRLAPDPDSQWNNAMKNAMEDVISAMDWIKANNTKYGIDKNKIVLSGYSAGAEIITNIVYGRYVDGWDRSGIAGAIDIAGNRLFWGGAIKTDAPILVIHGTADNINPYTDVLKLIEQLKAGGINYQLVPFEGVGHSFGSYENSQKVINHTTDFLYKNVATK